MKKNISKTTKTQKEGNGKRKQLQARKRNMAGLETAKKRKAKRSRVDGEVKQEASQAAEEGQAVVEFKAGEGEGYTIGIDIGDKRSRYCILDKEGKIVRESSVATLPASLKTVFSKLAGCRLAMEV